MIEKYTEYFERIHGFPIEKILVPFNNICHYCGSLSKSSDSYIQDGNYFVCPDCLDKASDIDNDILPEPDIIPFSEYLKRERGIDVPVTGEINGSWFADNGVPMMAECSCCGSQIIPVLHHIEVDDEGGSFICNTCMGLD